MKKQFTKLFRVSLIFSLALAFMSFQTISAQTVNGSVVDKTGVGIPGANVIVKGTTKGAVTDFDGKFKISVASVI